MKKTLNNRCVSGFTLIEIVTSLLLIAVGMLGLVALIGNTQKNASGSYSRTQASIIGYNIAEKMRSNRTYVINNPTAYTVLPASCAQASKGITALEQDLREFVCLIESTLPKGSGSIDFNVATNILTVSVSWDDSRGTNNVDPTSNTPVMQTFTFQTQL